MKIKIDGKEIVVSDENKNIVEIAEEAGIAIVAPCFRNQRKGGCCKACIIEVDGAVKYACGTKPVDGMNIIYQTPALKKARDLAIVEYVESLNNKESCGSGCGCGSNQEEKEEDSCCESGGCSCS